MLDPEWDTHWNNFYRTKIGAVWRESFMPVFKEMRKGVSEDKYDIAPLCCFAVVSVIATPFIPFFRKTFYKSFEEVPDKHITCV